MKYIFSVLAIFMLSSCVSMRTGGVSADAGGVRESVVKYAKSALNAEYKYSGTGADGGFDCSGLAQYVYAQSGIRIARTASSQYRESEKILKSNLLPADLVFFTTYGPGVTHVGIFIGGTSFIHAPSKGKRVSIADLESVYWKKAFVGAGRYIK